MDDVLTTGAMTSMEEARHGEAIGFVLFARGQCPSWVTPLFTMAVPENASEAGKPEGTAVEYR